MEKQTQDKSSLDTKSVTGQDPDRYEQGYGSFNEKDFNLKDQKETTLNETPGGTITGQTDEANIKTGRNENKSTISNTHSPSGDESSANSDKGNDA